MKRRGISYSIAGGTLLGAIRQGGHIPWDDDGDIFVQKEYTLPFLDMAEELKTLGYRVIPMFIGWKVQSAIALEKSGAGSGVGAVDVLVVQASPDGQYLEYCSETMREMFPNEEVPFEVWDSVGEIQFGHLTLQGPKGQLARQYLTQCFGPDWETIYNRGNNNAGLPSECTFIQGDIHDDEAYFKLADHNFDVICQFHLFLPAEIQRDIDLFTGHCDQYVFISSASAYQKPVGHHAIAEEVPLINPYWQYSDNKAQMEAILQNQSALPYTIVRPSHTSRNQFIPAVGDADVVAHRLLARKPVIVHGDGTSLWTFTHSTDFAPPFVKLLGNDAAIDDHFHLTSDGEF